MTIQRYQKPYKEAGRVEINVVSWGTHIIDDGQSREREKKKGGGSSSSHSSSSRKARQLI